MHLTELHQFTVDYTALWMAFIFFMTALALIYIVDKNKKRQGE